MILLIEGMISMVFFYGLEINTIGYTCRRYQNKTIRNYRKKHQLESICIYDWRGRAPLPNEIITRRVKTHV